MECRKLGKAKRTVSRIGLGLAAIGRPGYINLGHAEDLENDYDIEAMQQRAFQLLDTAWDSGVRYFDVARSYGKAEEFLGNWIRSRKVPEDEITVGSKWGYQYTANWQVQAEIHEQKQHSVSRLETQWQESQQNLGSFLNLYQIHSATLESGVLDRVEVIEKLASLKMQGVAIGLSVSGPKQSEVIHQAIRCTVDGVMLFDVVQATWNLLEQSATEAIDEAHESGMGIIIKESLANGRLTNRNQTELSCLPLIQLKQEADRLNVSIDALAMAAVLANPWADVVLSGAAKKEHLLSNLQAIQLNYDEELSKSLAIIAEPASRYWKTRSELQWN